MKTLDSRAIGSYVVIALVLAAALGLVPAALAEEAAAPTPESNVEAVATVQSHANCFNYDVYATAGFQVSDPLGLQARAGYAGSLDTEVLPKQPLGEYLLAGVTLSF